MERKQNNIKKIFKILTHFQKFIYYCLHTLLFTSMMSFQELRNRILNRKKCCIAVFELQQKLKLSVSVLSLLYIMLKCKGVLRTELFCKKYLPLIYTSILLFSSESRSSRPEVFCKKGVLRNFAKFTGKYLCQSLFFNIVAGLRPFFTEHLWWLLLWKQYLSK